MVDSVLQGGGVVIYPFPHSLIWTLSQGSGIDYVFSQAAGIRKVLPNFPLAVWLVVTTNFLLFLTLHHIAFCRPVSLVTEHYIPAQVMTVSSPLIDIKIPVIIAMLFSLKEAT